MVVRPAGDVEPELAVPADSARKVSVVTPDLPLLMIARAGPPRPRCRRDDSLAVVPATVMPAAPLLTVIVGAFVPIVGRGGRAARRRRAQFEIDTLPVSVTVLAPAAALPKQACRDRGGLLLGTSYPRRQRPPEGGWVQA